MRGRRGALLVVLVVLAGCRPSGAPPAPPADSAPVATVEVAEAGVAEADAGAGAGAGAAVSSPSTSTSTSTSTSAVEAGADAGAEAASTGRAVTPIAKVTKITLEQAQGGPAAVRCKGVAYSVSVDLAKNEWTYGLCVPTAAGRPTAQTPLSFTTGTLKPAQRARLEASYARMSIEAARGCGKDGGALTLRLDRAGGAASEKYVDLNWGCKEPAPEIAKGVKDFATTMMLIVNAP
jgi:hypothetical protein